MNAIYRLRNLAIGLFPGLADLYENIRFLRYLNQWRHEGCGTPLPALLKRALILQEAMRIKADVLVETGTYLGDTTWFFRNAVKEIYTIEIDHRLAELAQKRFRKWRKIHSLHGDSASILKDVVPKINGTVLYWLDGHYTPGIGGRGPQDCPLWDELTAIFNHTHRNFSILIDDARCFGTSPDYPQVKEVAGYLQNLRPDYEFRVEGDIMFFTRRANPKS